MLVFIGVSISVALWIFQLKKQLVHKEAENLNKDNQISNLKATKIENDRNNVIRQQYKRNERIIR
jgi:hypothetical protein